MTFDELDICVDDFCSKNYPDDDLFRLWLYDSELLSVIYEEVNQKVMIGDYGVVETSSEDTRVLKKLYNYAFVWEMKRRHDI